MVIKYCIEDNLLNVLNNNRSYLIANNLDEIYKNIDNEIKMIHIKLKKSSIMEIINLRFNNLLHPLCFFSTIKIQVFFRLRSVRFTHNIIII